MKRARCVACKRVRNRGVNPSGPAPKTGTAAPEQGLDNFERFWYFFPLAVWLQGLPGAIRWSQRKFEVDASTISRWIAKTALPNEPHRSGQRALPRYENYDPFLYDILEECLRLRRATGDPMPRRHGFARSPLLLESAGSALVWRLLIRARGVASMSRDGAMPSWLDRWTWGSYPKRGLLEPSEWSERVNTIQHIGAEMLEKMPEQAWNTAESQAWLLGWQDPARHPVLRTFLLPMEQTQSAEQRKKEKGRPPDGQVRPHRLAELLRQYPIPAILDQRRIEAFLRKALRVQELWAPFTSDNAVDRGLTYWL
ncbi:MAG: hypothetical protein H0V67_11440, partial [Geodermatophilaceae bacterium]|nr:hypothetical protein [Geodermatophilaceae bacterium]